MQKHVRGWMAALAVTVSLAGCGVSPGNLGGPTNGAVRSMAAGAPWSLLTYFALDNDLDHGRGIMDRLHATSRGGTSVAAVSFYDGSRPNDTVYVYEAAPGATAQEVNRPEADSGTAAALEAFVTFAGQNTPAQRRALSMADHGGGIIRGICSDWNGPGGKKIIHVNEVAQVLRKQPVDIMLFDACFMQMAEVAYELRGGAKYLLAAQTTTRGDFPYEDIVRVLEANPQAEGRDVASKLLRVVADNARYEVAFGAADIGRMDEVAQRLRTLSDLLIAKIETPATKKAVAAALRDATSYANETEPGMQMYNQYRDLVDVMERLAQVNDPAIQEAARAVATAGRASIIGERHRNAGWFGGELKLDKAAGLALYAPVDMSVEYRYMSSTWNKDTHWGDFLAKLNAGGTWGPAVQKDKYPFAFPSRNP